MRMYIYIYIHTCLSLSIDIYIYIYIIDRERERERERDSIAGERERQRNGGAIVSPGGTGYYGKTHATACSPAISKQLSICVYYILYSIYIYIYREREIHTYSVYTIVYNTSYMVYNSSAHKNNDQEKAWPDNGDD